jgi:hypothetical protein
VFRVPNLVINSIQYSRTLVSFILKLVFIFQFICAGFDCQRSLCSTTWILRGRSDHSLFKLSIGDHFDWEDHKIHHSLVRSFILTLLSFSLVNCTSGNIFGWEELWISKR